MSHKGFLGIPNSNAQHYLQVTLAGAASRVSAGTGGRGKSLALQVRQNVRGSTGQRASVGVGNTGTTNRGGAGAGVAVGGKEGTLEGGFLENLLHVREVVTLRKNVTTRADLEGVAGVLVPVVVDSVKVGVSLDLRGTATGLVEVVALEGNLVTGAIKVHVPVVVAVAGGRVVGFTVDVVVGDRDTVVSLSTQDIVLATNASSLDESSQSMQIAGKACGNSVR